MRRNYIDKYDVDIIFKKGKYKDKLRFKNCEDITINNEENLIAESFDGFKVIQTITTITIMQKRVEK